MARAACAVRVMHWVQGPRYHEGEVSTLEQVWAFLEHSGARLRVAGGGTVPPPVQVELGGGRHLSESHFLLAFSRKFRARPGGASLASKCVAEGKARRGAPWVILVHTFPR